MREWQIACFVAGVRLFMVESETFRTLPQEGCTCRATRCERCASVGCLFVCHDRFVETRNFLI